MKRLLCKNRMEAIQLAPKMTIIRRVAPGVYEAYKDYDEYYTHLLTLGKRVDRRWLAKHRREENEPVSLGD
jgi:hypothetical protein